MKKKERRRGGMEGGRKKIYSSFSPESFSHVESTKNRGGGNDEVNGMDRPECPHAHILFLVNRNWICISCM